MNTGPRYWPAERPAAIRRFSRFPAASSMRSPCGSADSRLTAWRAAGLGRLDRHVVEVQAPHHDLLARELRQHRAVELRLRGLDRDLPARAPGQLREERVARRPLVDDRGVAEAEVHRRGAGDPLE